MSNLGTEDGRKLLFFLYEAQPCTVQSFCSNINKSVAFQRWVRVLVEEGNLVLSNKLMTYIGYSSVSPS